jgi:hypothetical protein
MYDTYVTVGDSLKYKLKVMSYEVSTVVMVGYGMASLGNLILTYQKNVLPFSKLAK